MQMLLIPISIVVVITSSPSFLFLGATKHLYNWLCPLVGWSVCLLVTHSFDYLHVARYWPTWPCFFKCLYLLPSQWSRVIQLAAINCASEENFPICTSYEIKGFPTVKFFSAFAVTGQKGLEVG